MSYPLRPILLSFLLSTCLSTQLFAKEEESTNPLGCVNKGYHYKMNTLELTPGENGPHQTMYFFYNMTEEPVSLNQMRNDDSSRSLYLNHTIPPHQWSVLAASEDTLRFMCSTSSKKNHPGNVVDCAESVKICQNAQVRFGLNNKGNFWIVGNNTKNGALRQVVYYGIIP